MNSGIASPFRVGIVGAGYVSKYHIRSLQALRDVSIVGICDSDIGRAVSVQKEFRLPGAYRDLGEMRSTEPDVIHVLTPPASHCSLSIQALEMGCHVLVEKPMACSVEECEQMIIAARQAKRVLSVNHSARMDPIVLKALELVHRGACGEVLAVDFLRTSDYPQYVGGPVPIYYTGGGYPFLDIGVHGLTLLETFLGPIHDIHVQHRSTGRNPLLTFDEWHALANCKNGCGRMYLSWNVKPFQNELIVHGTRGVLHVDCYLQTCTIRKQRPMPKIGQRILSAASNSIQTLGGVAVNALRFATGSLTPSPGIGVGVNAFYKALREQTPAPVPAEEGQRTVYWIEKATRAAIAEKQQMRARDSVPPLPARILVTGATGALGSALLSRLLGAGETVRVLTRRPVPSLAANAQLHVVHGNLGDPEAVDRAVQGVELVFHIGAAMQGGAADFESGTIAGTKNVVSACLRYGVQKLVYVSSLTVLDHAGRERGAPVTESSPLEPHPAWRGFYTQSKLAAEQIVLEAIRSQQLPAVILRPAQIFGCGVTSAPAGAIALGRHWIVAGNGGRTLQLNYLDDVVDALLLAAAREGVGGRIVHLADPQTVTQREYINAYRLHRPDVSVRYVPVPVLYAGAFIVEVLGKLLRRELPLSRYRVRSLYPIAGLDGRTAAQVLGWSPAVGTYEGLRRTFGISPTAGSGQSPIPDVA
jgi:predicted dehydrogenase/nucleoside-diphosphate-sugar epimerase